MSISEQAIAARKNLTREMSEAERPISEEFRIVAKQWVDADAAASMLEDTKSALLSKLVLENSIDTSISRAEHLARSSDDMREHITKTNEARAKANLLKVQMRYIEMRFNEWQSGEANQRKERTFSRQQT